MSLFLRSKNKFWVKVVGRMAPKKKLVLLQLQFALHVYSAYTFISSYCYALTCNLKKKKLKGLSFFLFAGKMATLFDFVYFSLSIFQIWIGSCIDSVGVRGPQTRKTCKILHGLFFFFVFCISWIRHICILLNFAPLGQNL